MLLNLSPGISILIAIASSTIEKIIALYVTEWVEYPGFDLSRSGETWMAPVFKVMAFCMIKWIFFGTYTSQSKKSENWISVFLATDCEALKDNEVAPVSSSAVFPSSSTITGFFFYYCYLNSAKFQMHFTDVSSTTQFDGGQFSMSLCVSSCFMSKVVRGASDHCLKDMRTINSIEQWGHHLSLWNQMHTHCPL